MNRKVKGRKAKELASGNRHALRIENMRSEVSSVAKVDPFTAEVIRSAVIAITGEMKTNLMRTAYYNESN